MNGHSAHRWPGVGRGSVSSVQAFSFEQKLGTWGQPTAMPLCSVGDNGTMRQGVHWVPLGTDRRRESRLLVVSALARHGLKKNIALREGLFDPLYILSYCSSGLLHVTFLLQVRSWVSASEILSALI